MLCNITLKHLSALNPTHLRQNSTVYFWNHIICTTCNDYMYKSSEQFWTSSVNSLLDKVMSCNQWHIGVHQHHLMFKGHWRAPHKTLYGHKKKVCLDKTFPLGHLMLHFIMFLIHQMTTFARNGDWEVPMWEGKGMGGGLMSPISWWSPPEPTDTTEHITFPQTT